MKLLKLTLISSISVVLLGGCGLIPKYSTPDSKAVLGDYALCYKAQTVPWSWNKDALNEEILHRRRQGVLNEDDCRSAQRDVIYNAHTEREARNSATHISTTNKTNVVVK
ncbi:hypothetical protein [Vibrio sp. B1Z05]|uniref:hypothetical protein n=1 Tax=Vibrio sp. B1Z05 TaxID=2654980 RepID=UPI00128DB280|nr:hypothetical protein [Vibrio sp. B1Z05]MPW35704.1 hypothetical protein [Vibrio sp. B1Z05]